jgi:hypothetical protein
MSERDTPMFERNTTKCIVIGLIVLIAFFFAAGASRFGESHSCGRFQLVVRHANSPDIFVIDTATGQVWTNKYAAPDEAKRDLYQAKLSQDR